MLLETAQRNDFDVNDGNHQNAKKSRNRQNRVSSTICICISTNAHIINRMQIFEFKVMKYCQTGMTQD